MVLVLAAIYSYYCHQLDKNKNNQGTVDDNEQKEDDERVWLERWKKQGAFLYQNAVSRCTTTTDAAATHRQEGLGFDYHGGRPASRRRRRRRSMTVLLSSEEKKEEPDHHDDDGIAVSAAARERSIGTSSSGTSSSRSAENGVLSNSLLQDALPLIIPLEKLADDDNENDIVFRDCVKQEWIDATFGKDFCLQHQQRCTNNNNGSDGMFGPGTRKTVTLRNNNGNNKKVGVTLARFAAGVYVRNVSDEARMAGIRPESVLVAINDLVVLAEPTKSLLERLWQYEGYYTSGGNNNNKQNNGRSNSNNNNLQEQISIQEPVSLLFVHQGKPYRVLLLSNPPWGIQWAPCANLALVKRVSSTNNDSSGDLPRGSLVAEVNGRTMRDMDHVATGLHIRDLFENKQDIRITTVTPPLAARTSPYEHHHRNFDNNKGGSGSTDHTYNYHHHHHRHHRRPKSARTKSQTIDGVEINFIPIGYALGTLCSSSAHNVIHSPPRPTQRQQEDRTVNSLSELVAAGKVHAPMRRPKSPLEWLPPVAPSCPRIRDEQLLQSWEPLQALVDCLHFQRAFLEEDMSFVEDNCSNSNPQTGVPAPPIERLHQVISGPRGADIASAFLLQFISLICTVPGDDDEEESKAVIPKKIANELTSMLLKLSRKNESFCQRLYFLLRSYVSTFETRSSRGRPNSDDSDHAAARNLHALLNCLELLRFAEEEVAGRRRQGRVVVNGQPSIEGKDVAPGCQPSVPTPIPATPESPADQTFASSSPKQHERKGVLGFLRKKTASSPMRRMSPTRRRRRQEQRQHTAQEQHPSTILSQETRTPSSASLVQNPSTMYNSMSDFLTELDTICATIERSLQKSFRQKIADWALQPWSAGKDAALVQVTADMRTNLAQTTDQTMLLVNPVDSSELLSSVDYDECYILPSAHFPILLTFNVSERRCSDTIVGEERLYRTKVELVSLSNESATSCGNLQYFAVRGAVACKESESGLSSAASPSQSGNCHWGGKQDSLRFETRSSWGAPQTLYLRVSGTSDAKDKKHSDVGFCWIDLSELWGTEESDKRTKTIVTDVWPMSFTEYQFDDHGDLPDDVMRNTETMQLEIRLTTESIGFNGENEPTLSRKRMLLYKHDHDLRQEAFAMQFIKTCDDILKSSGLDMKILTFQCIPVGARRGFVEWVCGSAPLSEICYSRSGSILSSKGYIDDKEPKPADAISKYESLRRLGGLQADSLRRIASGKTGGGRGSIADNPVQDFLRSVAFDASAPYLIRREAMDCFVKSCAGYSVITYILGVGDRHLDNLLMHQSGRFFHCDFSFLLGSDPKKFMPMRITEDLIHGMGGKESDNYAKFLSHVGAAFLALRRPENVRILLSMVRLVQASCLPDITENQTLLQAVGGIRDRLRLDLSEDGAISYMEDLVETMLSNRIWKAVDAIHQLGRTF